MDCSARPKVAIAYNRGICAYSDVQIRWVASLMIASARPTSCSLRFDGGGAKPITMTQDPLPTGQTCPAKTCPARRSGNSRFASMRSQACRKNVSACRSGFGSTSICCCSAPMPARNCASRCRRRTLPDTIALTEAWHHSVVRELRAVRTTMKRWSEDKTLPISEPAAALRLAVKKAELDAERIEHELLAEWAASSAKAAPPRRRRKRSPPISACCSIIIRASAVRRRLRPRQLIAAAMSER